ncbi:hypothetical protein GCM10023189_58730 [Nibrella saemangeumensis]|uniref:histidine kinase n=1 Tax=Nibrella saemangeumensis TaxID=1084526 RepID=A0ABP8NR21_9BACT
MLDSYVNQLSSATLLSIVESSQNGIVVLTAVRGEKEIIEDFEVIYSNTQAKKQLGLAEEQVLNKRLTAIFPSPYELLFRFKQVVETGLPERFELPYNLATALPSIWYECAVTKQDDGVVVTLTDITRQKQAFQRADRMITRLHSVLDSSPAAVCLMDAMRDPETVITDFRFVTLNNFFSQMVERPVEALIGERFLSIFTSASSNGLLETFIQVVQTGIPFFIDIYLEEPALQGWYNVTAVKQADGLAVTMLDIKDRKEIARLRAAEEKLREREHFICQVVQSTPDVISVLDLDKKEFIYLNKGTDLDDPDSLEATPAICYTEVLTLIHPDDRALVEAYNESFRTLPDGEFNTVEYRVMDETDTPVWYKARGRVFKRDHAGRATQRLCISQDITQQVLAGQQIRETAERLQAVLDGAPVGIGMLVPVRDAQGQTVDFWTRALNPRFALRKGHSMSDMLVHPFSDLFPTFHRSDLFNQLVQVADLNHSFRKEMYINDGRTKGWYQLSAIREGDSVIVTSVDISDRKQAEDTVQQMLNGSMAAIAQLKAVRDTDGAVVDFVVKAVNVAGEELTRLPADDLIGQPIQDVLSEDMAPLYDDLVDVLITGQPLRMQFELTYEQVDYWFDLSVVKQDDGLILTCLDVSEIRRVQQQLETTIGELKRSYGTLEHLALIASHDLQEPLRTIQALGDIVISQYADQSGAGNVEIVHRMQRSASQMQLLVNDLLTYSRLILPQQAFQKINLETLVQEILAELSGQIQEKRAQVVVESLPVIRGGVAQWRLLVHNLVANSLLCSRPGIAPEVQIRSRTIAGRAAGGIAGLEANRTYYEIRISDNGIGFDANEDPDHIFDLSQRLHPETGQAGTGIGLAVCKRVVENHGGIIIAQRTPGEGTTFLIYIPVSGRQL